MCVYTYNRRLNEFNEITRLTVEKRPRWPAGGDAFVVLCPSIYIYFEYVYSVFDPLMCVLIFLNPSE